MPNVTYKDGNDSSSASYPGEFWERGRTLERGRGQYREVSADSTNLSYR